jgi:hypothetical protein
MALEGSGWRPGTCREPAEPVASPGGGRPGRRVALRVDAEQLAELPARDPRAAPRPGQLRPDVRRQLDPRDGPVGFGQIGRGAARGEPRGDRGPA